jgi:hypothetical protein
MDVHEFQSLRTLIHRETGIWLRDGKQVMPASRLRGRLSESLVASGQTGVLATRWNLPLPAAVTMR